MELSQAKIDRQDFVDNAIFALINEVNPTEKEIEWDIDFVGSVRDAISAKFEEKGICSEEEFYPSAEE